MKVAARSLVPRSLLEDAGMAAVARPMTEESLVASLRSAAAEEGHAGITEPVVTWVSAEDLRKRGEDVLADELEALGAELAVAHARTIP